jgi:hypothetical protein
VGEAEGGEDEVVVSLPDVDAKRSSAPCPSSTWSGCDRFKVATFRVPEYGTADELQFLAWKLDMTPKP